MAELFPPPGAETLVCLTEVPAVEPWWKPPVVLQKGERYFFRASGRWFDASIPHDPNGRDVEKLEKWKRFIRCKENGATWFTLIGSVGKDSRSFFPIGDGSFWPDGWVATTSGQFYCFANDVRFMYWNNKLKIDLEIWQ